MFVRPQTYGAARWYGNEAMNAGLFGTVLIERLSLWMPLGGPFCFAQEPQTQPSYGPRSVT